jgi:hypothetical protein
MEMKERAETGEAELARHRVRNRYHWKLHESTPRNNSRTVPRTRALVDMCASKSKNRSSLLMRAMQAKREAAKVGPTAE